MESVKQIEDAKIERRIKKVLVDDRLDSNQLKTLSKYNKQLIREGISINTRIAYLKDISLLGRISKLDYEKFTEEKLNEVLDEMLEKGYEYNNGNLRRVGKYSNPAILHFKISAKKFMKWLGKDDVIENFSLNRKNGNYKLPEDILTKDEVLKLISMAQSFRDKALLFSLYESGCRKGEWMNLKYKDITLDEYGAVCVVSGKTGSRRVRLLDSIPDLTAWLNSHPTKEPNDPLWVNTETYKGTALGFNGLLRILRLYSQRAGIKKKVYPHLLRHSRLTHLAGEGFTEAELRILAGWSADSKMPRVYIHLSGADVDRKLLEKAGKLNDKKKDIDKTKPKTCVVCEAENSVTNSFCYQCGRPLDVRIIKQIDEIEKEAEQKFKGLSPDVKKKIMELIS